MERASGYAAGMAGDLPDEVLDALARRGAAPLEALPTEREVFLPSLDGRPPVANLWLVRTSEQLWLIAARRPKAEDPKGLALDVAVATGDPASVRVDRSPLRTSLVIDEVRAGVPEPERVAAVVERFSRSAGGKSRRLDARLGDPLPGPAVLAPGAPPPPDGWRSAGGEPGDPWLFVAATSTEVRLPGFVRDVGFPIGLAVSERRVRAFLLGGPPGGVDLEGTMAFAPQIGGGRLAGPSLRVAAPLGGGGLAELARIAALSPGRRWAHLALARLDEAPEDAAEAIEAAIERGHEAELGLPLALVASIAADLPRAAAFLEQALLTGPEPADAAEFAHRVKRARGLTPARAKAVLERTRRPPAEPPRGAPWPPRTPVEVWALAAHRPLGAAAATGPLARLEDRSRSLRLTAALVDTPLAWRAAAHAARHAGSRAEALAALGRAQDLEPSPDDGWLAVVWATERAPRSDRPVPWCSEVERALELDPEATSAAAHVEPGPMLSLAKAALERGHPSAGALLEAADAADPNAEPELRAERAEALSGAAPARSARILRRAASSCEPPDSARWWFSAAKGHLAANETQAALDAVRNALRADPLTAARWREGAELPGLECAPEERRWWEHVAEVLDPRDQNPGGRAPLAELGPADLDRLHPEGRGWLAALRNRVRVPPLPHRDQLTRGLERLDSQPTSAVVAELCAALGLEPVPTYIYRGDDAFGVAAWPTEPPVLLIGGEHLERASPRYLEPAALRHALAVEIAHLAGGHPVLALDDGLLGTSRSVYQVFGRFAGTAETAVDLITLIPGLDQLAKIKKVLDLSRKLFAAKSAVDKAGHLARPLYARWVDEPKLKGVSRDGWTGTALLLRLQADRVALRLGGDLAAAATAVLATGTRPAGRVAGLKRDGLAALLSSSEPERLGADEAIRLTALVSDAAGWGFDR